MGMDSSHSTRTHAIVIGAGMGGLTAAAALARHFEAVTILESDELDDRPAFRVGVPQGKHVHGLLGGGITALSSLFPGFQNELALAGAIPIRPGLDTRLEQPGQDAFPRCDFGVVGYSMSRPLLEHVVRHLVKRTARVTLRSGCRVQDIIAAPDNSAAVGVRVKTGGELSEVVHGDLIVDASGRGALTMNFLAAAGYDAPGESAIDVDIRYTCGVFVLPPECDPDWKILLTRPDPTISGRRAIMFPIEGKRRWHLGLGGVNGDSAPKDLPGFIEYARTLRTPTAYNAIVGAKLDGDLVRFAFPRSYRRHFESLSRFPRGLLPIADAICRINPSFGQGMSVAALEALLLDSTLAKSTGQRDRLSDLAKSFFSSLAGVLNDPWAAAGQDYVYPHLAHARPSDFEAKLKFQRALGQAAWADPSIYRLLWEVSNLITPSSVFREPAIAARIATEMVGQ